jgi:hypothetical protein
MFLLMLTLVVLGSEDSQHEGVNALEELGSGSLLGGIMHGKGPETRGVADVLTMVSHTVSEVVVKLGVGISFASIDMVLLCMSSSPGDFHGRGPFGNQDLAKKVPKVTIFV